MKKTKPITAVSCTENIITFHRKGDYIRAYQGMKMVNHRRLANAIYWQVDSTRFNFSPLFAKAGWIATVKDEYKWADLSY